VVRCRHGSEKARRVQKRVKAGLLNGAIKPALAELNKGSFGLICKNDKTLTDVVDAEWHNVCSIGVPQSTHIRATKVALSADYISFNDPAGYGGGESWAFVV
jgi:hypothetical protein